MTGFYHPSSIKSVERASLESVTYTPDYMANVCARAMHVSLGCHAMGPKSNMVPVIA